MLNDTQLALVVRAIPLQTVQYRT